MSARVRRRRRLIPLVLAGAMLAGCSASPGSPPPPPSATAGPLTLPALAGADLAATRLEFGEVIAEEPAFTTTTVTYASDGLTASGSLSIPTAAGPHPGVVLVHGIVNPNAYLPGSGMAREQEYFVREGYVVLSLDLRSSTAEPTSAAALGIDLGSTLDVINGVRALRSSALPALDGQRIAMIGHSLGGLLVINAMVVDPELADAVVAFAPASTDPRENVEHLTTLFGGTPTPIVTTYGTPEENPDFWEAISPRSLIDRVEAPLLILHGTADQIVPIGWSEQTARVWESAGKEVVFLPLPDEGHIFQARWESAMQRASDFLSTRVASPGPGTGVD